MCLTFFVQQTGAKTCSLEALQLRANRASCYFHGIFLAGKARLEGLKVEHLRFLRKKTVCTTILEALPGPVFLYKLIMVGALFCWGSR